MGLLASLVALVALMPLLCRAQASDSPILGGLTILQPSNSPWGNINTTSRYALALRVFSLALWPR